MNKPRKQTRRTPKAPEIDLGTSLANIEDALIKLGIKVASLGEKIDHPLKALEAGPVTFTTEVALGDQMLCRIAEALESLVALGGGRFVQPAHLVAEALPATETAPAVKAPRKPRAPKGMADSNTGATETLPVQVNGVGEALPVEAGTATRIATEQAAALPILGQCPHCATELTAENSSKRASDGKLLHVGCKVVAPHGQQSGIKDPADKPVQLKAPAAEAPKAEEKKVEAPPASAVPTFEQLREAALGLIKRHGDQKAELLKVLASFKVGKISEIPEAQKAAALLAMQQG